MIMKKFWQGSSYAPVPTANEAVDLEFLKEKTQPSKKIKSILRHIQWLVALGLTMIVFTLVVFHRAPQAKDPVLETCGNSSSEALSLGCNFDIISFAWLPARCFDQELMDQFLDLRDWKWYLDTEGQQTVDLASVAAGQYEQLYVTQEYHMYHCTYMWRKMHRALLAGNVVDGYIGDMHHTAHCEMQILDRSRPLDGISTLIYIKYASCPIRKQDFLGRWGWYRIVNGRRVYRDP